MSCVSNYVLLPGTLNDPFDLNALNECVNAIPTSDRTGFVRVDQYSVGSKYMEMHTYILAANYLHISDMAQVIVDFPWKEPDTVFLLHQGQHDDHPELFSYDQLKARFRPEDHPMLGGSLSAG